MIDISCVHYLVSMAHFIENTSPTHFLVVCNAEIAFTALLVSFMTQYLRLCVPARAKNCINQTKQIEKIRGKKRKRDYAHFAFLFK